MAEAEDRELLERWRSGDTGAGNLLARRYFGMLARFFHNKVSSRDDAVELVSETLMICAQNRDKIESKSVRSYIFAIACNQLRAYYRKQRKRARERDDFAEFCAADVGPSQATLLSRKREQQLLVQALRRIPVDFQIALELKLFEGLTGAQIAELLGIPAGTVQSRLRLGKARLVTAIEGASPSSSLYKSTVSNLEDWASALRAQLGGLDEQAASRQ